VHSYLLGRRQVLTRLLNLGKEATMRKPLVYLYGIILMVLVFGGTAGASMVTVARGEVPSGIGSQGKSATKTIVLTFGDEKVLIHERPLPLPGGVLMHEKVSRKKLFLVRDHRAVSKRQGYDVLYSYKGFHLASVERPRELSGTKSVKLWPVTKSKVVIEKAGSKKAAPDPAIEKILDTLDPTSYENYLSSLAEDLDSRYLCSPEIVDARDIIAQHFRDLGLETYVVQFPSYCWPKRCNAPQAYNVIGIKRGQVSPEKFCLVGAHYDSINEDAPCWSAPGANDNGSGTAGVMELARIFATVDTNISVVFAAFSGEEEDILGSKAFVKSLTGNKPIGNLKAANLKSFVVMDMISYYDSSYGLIVEGSNRKASQKTAAAKLMQLGATYTDFEMEKTFEYEGSDHEPFLNKGMAGALLIEADWENYSYMHTADDLMEYQDIPYAMEVLRLAAAMLATESR